MIIATIPSDSNAITVAPESTLASLAIIGQAANAAAARHTFSNYRARIAANTLRRQDADLALFARYLRVVGIETGNDYAILPDAWRGMTYGLVEGFREWMLDQGYAVTSVNVRLSTVKTYTKLALRAGAISTDDYTLIKTVNGYAHKEARRIDEQRQSDDVGTRKKGAKKADAVTLSAAQVKALKGQPDTAQGRRDALLVCLLFDHGLRCGEVAALDVSAINLTDGTMMFYRPKVDKVQTHTLTPNTLHAALAYFKHDAPPAGKLLRASIKGGALVHAGMSERAITKRIDTLGAALGIPVLSAHDGRHSFATRAARNKTDSFALQEAGGWNSLAMPRRYVQAAKIANEGVNLGDE